MPRTYRRILQRTGVALGLALASTMFAASPASAHDLSSVVTSEQGCGWPNGSYSVLDWADIPDRRNNITLATGYLLWNGQYQENCVVTKRVGQAHGVTGFTEAILERQGKNPVSDSGQYAHYAAVSAYAAGTCVKWWSSIQTLGGGPIWGTGRSSWGNCS
ncbi:hypothetical protein ACFOY2_22765 [Nonomuraea purpurea]|uniref:Uncharacterized protein n=1 Tax=Nonomuraea purpurea TaxID=1849276 RepID=A0ABV8G7X1_9ACTN